ncbi:glutamate 5-kinase [Aestuariibacter halophilus]|uniref:Glutamate 5-kinase n=1 Tax=Fluctibacter halophilus TaxID=226011 RepID=A0ABS8GAZ2_9ALTE|nr:glutamate 5-kinase [Aestuariibacter halophilus]MCC2616980.1 glutamate 5-kinase [Aestuariibacter halophilus]
MEGATQFKWQRAVVKVGSALVRGDGAADPQHYVARIAGFIEAALAQGKEIILVSSGSVAAGKDHIAVYHQPTIAEKQAMAAIGQMRMMANWQQYFSRPCAQLLLTYGDLHHRTRYVNIKNTLRELLKHSALPIVNENDTVAVNELKVGDNDNLAAYTAMIAQADTLFILSDIDGLFTADPRRDPGATKIPVVETITPDIHRLAGGAGSSVGTGGMQTKLQAAEKCANSGIQTVIVNGRQDSVFEPLLQGVSPGTLFLAQQSGQSARSQWLKHTLKSQGEVLVDEGAADALLRRGASLLPSGIVDVIGQFHSGDAITVRTAQRVIAKGLANYSAADLSQLKGLRTSQIATVLGYTRGDVAIHRDDLILLTGQ